MVFSKDMLYTYGITLQVVDNDENFHLIPTYFRGKNNLIQSLLILKIGFQEQYPLLIVLERSFRDFLF